MLIGVPKEIKTDEYRVGLVPATIKPLTAKGHNVVVETGAGRAPASAMMNMLELVPKSLPAQIRFSRGAN